MKQIEIPYGRAHILANVEEENLMGVYESVLLTTKADPILEVEQALNNPIESQKLEDIAKGKKN